MSPAPGADAEPARPTIRAARPDEAAALSELAFRSKAHWAYTEEMLEVFRAELTIDPDEILSHRAHVAEVGGRIAGFYTLAPLAPLTDRRIELGHLFVDPSTLSRGIGAALFRHACETAQEAGYASFEIQSDPNAADFYRSRGATLVREDPSSIPGRTLPVFEMRLRT